MLMPYLVLYRLSKWFSLTQGKLSQQKQYLTLAFTIFSQFLILHATQDFDLRLSSPRQPGHGLLSRVNARQRRQFIPQGAISFVEIAGVFFDLFDVMTRFTQELCEYPRYSSPTRYSLQKVVCVLAWSKDRKGHFQEHKETPGKAASGVHQPGSLHHMVSDFVHLNETLAPSPAPQPPY